MANLPIDRYFQEILRFSGKLTCLMVEFHFGSLYLQLSWFRGLLVVFDFFCFSAGTRSLNSTLFYDN